MKLLSAAKKVEESVGETLTYMDFPTEHWSRIRTNNLTERVNREIRRRTRAIGAFPDGKYADARLCQTSPCCRFRMGLEALYGHGTSIQDGN